MKSLAEIRSAWLKQLFVTEPADRARAAQAVRRLYRAAGFAEPQHMLWYDSPFAASWAVALLIAPYHFLWGQKLSGSGLTRDDRQRIDRTRATLATQLGTRDWNETLAAVGGPMGMHLQMPPVPSRMMGQKFVSARFTLTSDASQLFTVHNDDDDLARAESHFWGGNRGALRSALHCPTTDQLIGSSFAEDYSFSTMADDEHRVGDREPPDIMAAAWDVARSAGMWWAFQNAAIMSERPTEIHVNDRYLLHRTDGPAVVFRDDARAFVWNGKAVPEPWIMNPQSVPPRDYKGFDPTFKKHVDSLGKPAPKATKRAKPASILKTALPVDRAARLEQLRAHGGGKLPLYDRYQAGAHTDVWRELVALGPAVRDDANVADALAVAYETMYRVEANIRTLVQRLTALGYTFMSDPSSRDAGTMPSVQMGSSRIDLNQLMQQLGKAQGAASSPQLSGLFNMMSKARDLLGASQKSKETPSTPARPHTPPPPDIHKRIVDFEKEFAVLPLSLRVFYEVVGEVNFIGTHPTLDPKNSSLAPDPLVVYGLDEGLVEYDDEEDGHASALTIAPDDLHKANTSGGDPYEMAIPELRADGELLNERHGVLFVDYLRLALKFGGFPGYEGAESPPREIAALADGLVAF